MAAENIAANYATAEEVVRGRMESVAHRRNVLNCDLREIGVGYAKHPASDNRPFWVQTFGARTP